MSAPFAGNNGHTIFRGQPSYTHFNKSFECAGDALFLSLNEIAPFYLKEEQQKNEKCFDCCKFLHDPRTKAKVQKVFYDHTIKYPPTIRCNGKKSNLTKEQHTICLQVLQAWQEHRIANENDVALFNKLQPLYLNEKQHLQQYVDSYASMHKENIYTPTKRLLQLYKVWYKLQAQIMLEQHEDVFFNTHTGLPHVRVCKGLTTEEMQITNVHLLEITGYVPLWNSIQTNWDCKNIHCRLESFAESYNESMREKSDILQMRNSSSAEDQEDDVLYDIPLDALLFLLTAGEYVDLCSEYLLEINVDLVTNKKLFKFYNPLPAKNCGWHTYNQMVQQAFVSYLTLPGNTKWLHMKNAEVNVVKEEIAKEIYCHGGEQPKFPPLQFDDYLQKFGKRCKKVTSKLKSNSAILKWQLKGVDSSTENEMNILTILELPPALNECATKFLGAHTIKLEYKPQFGCEIMTKYELLKLWLQLRLISGFTDIEPALCLRIDATDFEIELEERLTLAQIESQLADTYHVNMPQLLANLAMFLKLLSNMPAGKYMLRYNPKFKDKLMLCATTTEITQNTVSLHALLQTEPTDLLFMTQPHNLAIAEGVCSVRHSYNEIAPCAFPIFAKYNQCVDEVTAEKNFNDRGLILKRKAKKIQQQLTEKKNFAKKQKRIYKAKRRSLNAAKIGEESKTDNTFCDFK